MQDYVAALRPYSQPGIQVLPQRPQLRMCSEFLKMIEEAIDQLVGSGRAVGRNISVDRLEVCPCLR